MRPIGIISGNNYPRFVFGQAGYLAIGSGANWALGPQVLGGGKPYDAIRTPTGRVIVIGQGAIANSRSLSYSDNNGVSWTTIPLATSGGAVTPYFDDNKKAYMFYSYGKLFLVAFASGSGTHVWQSIDNGLTFTYVTQLAFAGLQQPQNAAIANSGRVVCGVMSNAANYPQHYTDDGVTFDRCVPGTNGINNAFNIAYSPKLNLFATLVGSYAIYTSPDGLTWTNRQAISIPNAGYQIVWCEAAQKFVYVATNGVIYTSVDGITWTNPGSAGAGNGGFMTDGRSGLLMNGTDNKIWTSIDGVNWTQQTTPGTPTFQVYQSCTL